MSLSGTPPVKTFAYGVIAAGNLDDRQFLDDLLGDKLPHIGHLYTNGANPLVTDWARVNGITYTVYPINGGNGLPKSNRQIIEASDFVYVVGSAESKSAGRAIEQCKTEAKRREAFKHKLVAFEAIDHWRSKACQAAEILDAAERDEIEKNPILKALKGVL